MISARIKVGIFALRRPDADHAVGHGHLSGAHQRSRIGWVAEGGTIPAADPGLGAGTAIPHKLSVRIEYSNELAEDSSPGVEQILRSVLVQRAAISVDVAAFEGSGVSPVPLGMGNVSGIGNVSAATAGTSIAWASAAAGALEASYAPPPIRVGAGHRDGQEPAGCQGRVLG